MKERIFTDINGEELIVKHRKSAVFFEREANIEKPNSYGERHAELVCITELKRKYVLSEKEFKGFCEYCKSIADESWSNFTPKVADSIGADYNEYYDREFDNEGSLSIGESTLRMEGPYAQPKSNGEIVRLYKFNKRKFESFLYDLNKDI